MSTRDFIGFPFVEFIYCGRVLDDEQTLAEQGVRTGSTIHVFQKDIDTSDRDMTVTEQDIETAVFAYRNVFMRNGTAAVSTKLILFVI